MMMFLTTDLSQGKWTVSARGLKWTYVMSISILKLVTCRLVCCTGSAQDWTSVVW